MKEAYASPDIPDVKNITFFDIVMFIILSIVSIIAAYYGWVYGSRNAPYFLAILQAIGSTIRSYIVYFIGYTQEYARRSR